MSEAIDRLDTLVRQTVSNNSYEFHNAWPAIVAVLRAANSCFELSFEASGHVLRRDLREALDNLDRSVP